MNQEQLSDMPYEELLKHIALEYIDDYVIELGSHIPYFKELQKRLNDGEKAIKAMGEIRNVIHGDTHFQWTNCELSISNIFAQYDKKG